MKSLELLSMLLFILMYSCVSKTEANLEIRLNQIYIDYHNIESNDSRHHSSLFAPESINLHFTIINKKENTINLMPLSKSSNYKKINEYGRFKMIYMKDTITLLTLTDKVEIVAGEKIDLVAELPYESYFIIKEIAIIENLKSPNLEDFSKIKFNYFRSKRNLDIPCKIDVDNANYDLFLIFSDTTIVINNHTTF